MATARLDTTYWAERYVAGDHPWDIGGPSTPLATFLEGRSDKSIHILLPGAGHAHEAELAHRLGFTHVFPMDFAGTSLDALIRRCPDFPVAHLIVGDFFAHSGQYDLILEQTFFCALDPGLRPAYVQLMHALLKPGGTLAGVLFDQVPNPVGPPFGGSLEEYGALFRATFPDARFERCHNSIPPRAGRELWFSAQKAKPYQPIDCNFYDHFEAAATLKETVRIRLRDGSEHTGIIVDLRVRDKVEWMEMNDGRKIRLDEVIDLQRPGRA